MIRQFYMVWHQISGDEGAHGPKGSIGDIGAPGSSGNLNNSILFPSQYFVLKVRLQQTLIFAEYSLFFIFFELKDQLVWEDYQEKLDHLDCKVLNDFTTFEWI